MPPDAAALSSDEPATEDRAAGDPASDVSPGAAPTLLERMTAVMSEDRARAWLGQRRVRVEGEVADDPQRPTPTGQRWMISGS